MQSVHEVGVGVFGSFDQILSRIKEFGAVAYLRICDSLQLKTFLISCFQADFLFRPLEWSFGMSPIIILMLLSDRALSITCTAKFLARNFV